MAISAASGLGNEIEGLARWSLHLFGGFELSVLPGNERVALPRKRQRVLVAYLALSPNCRTSRRKLATLLWGDATDETALENLRTELWSVRKALGDAQHRVIASKGEDIVLDATAFAVDVLMFRGLAAQSDRAELEAAAKLYSGELLDGLGIENEEFESWRRTQATRCRDQAIEVLNRLMTQLAQLGETEQAIEAGLRILEFDPLHEAAGRRLMRLYGGSGRRGAAAQLYRSLSDALKSDLDAQPEAETRALYAEIARGGEETPAPATPHAKPPPPLPMLSPPSEASREPPLRPAFRLRTGLAVFAGVAVVATALLFYQSGFSPGIKTAERPSGIAVEWAASASQAGAISVVVLPFLNLSGDVSQEFFSDGMTAEITTALAKVRDLQVVARASAFQFKGVNSDMRAVGRALGARYLIDGSVRSTGNRVRITVQLIRTDTGVNIWSESYDRELTDLFAIQESIAEAIAGELMVPLGLPAGQRLVASRIGNPEIYEQYLRGLAQLRLRIPSASPTLETIVARAPGFAPGWASLAGAYRGDAAVAARSGDFKTAVLLTDKVEAAARKAIQLDAGYAVGYSELAAAQTRRGKWAEAEDLYKRAFVLDPNDPELLQTYSIELEIVGRLKEALRMRERLRALEPLVPIYNQATARIMLANGQIDASIAILEPDLSTAMPRNVYLAEAYAINGRFAYAADTLLRISTEIDRRSVEDAARLLRIDPLKTNAPANLPALVADLGFVYAYIGAPERMLEYPEQALMEGDLIAVQSVWRPSAVPLRKTERFKALVRNAALVDYWRARGWPDLCRPTTGDDFVCE